jgi:protein-tyrosine phosphatase
MPALRRAKLIPVLTHPERNVEIAAKPQLLEDWYDAGAVIQLTGASVSGHMGQQAQRVSWLWLKHGMVHVVASDAHDPARRPPTWSTTVEALVQGLNHHMARRLVIENPLHVLMGKPVQQLRRDVWPQGDAL